jgi:hypothetical protein
LLLDKAKFDSLFSLFDPPVLDKNFHNDILFGIYVGDKHPEIREGIDIIALYTTSRSYAPVTRQGNTVLIGVNSYIEHWSKPFQKFVRELAQALNTSKDKQ